MKKMQCNVIARDCFILGYDNLGYVFYSVLGASPVSVKFQKIYW